MEQMREREAKADGAGPVLTGLSEFKTEERLQQAVPGLQDSALSFARGIHHLVLKGGEPARRVADFFHGTWLGHPLHPVMTDVVIGAWSFGSLMDFISLIGRAPYARQAADRLITIGTVAALPTAVAGLTDYSAVPKNAAATGATHGLINTVALVLYTLSLRSRRGGSRPLAMLLSGIAFGLIMVSAWLGGEMSYRYRVGVNKVESPSGPETWQPVLAERELPEHQPRRVEVDGQAVLLYRHQGRIYAIGAVCAHEGGSLHEGSFMEHRVQCPLHQTVYDLRSGRVVHGPSTYAVPCYEARVRNGQVEIWYRPG